MFWTTSSIKLLANFRRRSRKKGLSPQDRVGDLLRAFVAEAGDRALIITHANADPDGVASAIILSELLERLGLKASVAFPEGASKLSRKIMSQIGIKLPYLQEPQNEKYDSVAVVDATNCIQLGSFCSDVKQAKVLMVFDHHTPPGDLVSSSHYSVVKTEPATTVLVYQAVRDLSLKLNPKLATLALTGILFDSRRFFHATLETFKATASLIEEGGDYGMALSLLEEEETFSERVAKLKGAMRCQVLRVGDNLIALSEVGSFEASVARALISLGADVSLVASEKEEGCKLSIRISRSFYEKTRLSASKDLGAALAQQLEGEGGGHDMAGSFTGKCRASEVLREALKVVSNKLLAKPRPL